MSKVILADKGIALLPIVVEEGAGEVVMNAAKELAHYLKRITGAAFEIKEGDVAECRIYGPNGFEMAPLVNPVVDLKLHPEIEA